MAATVALLCPTAAMSSESPHVHGLVSLDLAIDANLLSIHMESPLDSLLGFEHPPHDKAQQRAVDSMFARLNAAASLFAPEEAAGCKLRTENAHSDALQAGAASGGHGDLDADFTFRCEHPAAIHAIDLGGLLDAFPRIHRINAQIAAPGGQFRGTLTSPERILRWGP